jgi:hypothetical protein
VRARGQRTGRQEPPTEGHDMKAEGTGASQSA